MTKADLLDPTFTRARCRSTLVGSNPTAIRQYDGLRGTRSTVILLENTRRQAVNGWDR